MKPSKNDLMANGEDDEGDMCQQPCTFIAHRVCNPSLHRNHFTSIKITSSSTVHLRVESYRIEHFSS